MGSQYCIIHIPEITFEGMKAGAAHHFTLPAWINVAPSGSGYTSSFE
jgi:hypothetical protein